MNIQLLISKAILIFKNSNLRLDWMGERDLTFFAQTPNEGISGKTGRATADRIMIGHLTPCILTTSAWTWVLAALIDTRLVEGTFWASRTFRSACRRSANIIDQACANGHFVDFTTLTVGTARRWMAWICCRYWVGDYNWRCGCNIKMRVNVKRILDTNIYFSVFRGRRRKDSQYNHRSNCSVVHDSQHGIQHLCRIHQGMGCDTCCWRKPLI